MTTNEGSLLYLSHDCFCSTLLCVFFSSLRGNFQHKFWKIIHSSACLLLNSSINEFPGFFRVVFIKWLFPSSKIKISVCGFLDTKDDFYISCVRADTQSPGITLKDRTWSVTPACKDCWVQLSRVAPETVISLTTQFTVSGGGNASLLSLTALDKGRRNELDRWGIVTTQEVLCPLEPNCYSLGAGVERKETFVDIKSN